MLPEFQVLSNLIGSLYDAAGNPPLWDHFLRQLTESTGAQSAALVLLDVGRSDFTMSRSWQVDPEATRLYREHFGSIDVWAQRGLNKRPALPFTSQELCSLSELKNTEVYRDYMVRFEFEHAMFVVAENTASRVASVSLYRDSSRPEFTSSDLDLLRVLTPHVQRAFKLHLKFSELKAQSQQLETALDMLPTGVFFLGATGEIILMNRSAAGLVSERDGLLATSRGLRAELPAESSLLERAIRHAVSPSNGKVVTTGGSVRVSRRTRSPLHVLISPIRDSNINGISVGQTFKAVAFVTDPSRRPRPTHDILRALFGLTPAECRVALLLCDGLAPKKIADSIGVTGNTVRAQIKNIFCKTGVNRQGELIRLLLDQFSS